MTMNLKQRLIYFQNSKYYVIDRLTNETMGNSYMIQIGIFQDSDKNLKSMLTVYSKLWLQKLKETVHFD